MKRVQLAQYGISYALIAATSAAAALTSGTALTPLEILDSYTNPDGPFHAVMRAGVADIGDATTDARTLAWAAWAYDKSGKRENARYGLQLLVGAVVLEQREKVPKGVLPALLTENGEAATAWMIRDMNAVGWFVTACALHADAVDGKDRARWLNFAWPAVQASSDLLADWSLGPNGPMLPSFQWSIGRDGTSNDTLVLTLAALHAAGNMAALRGEKPNPDWATRESELLSRVLLLGQGDAPIDLDPLVAYWVRTTLVEDPGPRAGGLRALRVRCAGAVHAWPQVPVPEQAVEGSGPKSDALDAALAIIRSAQKK